ncbi:hypothetical protein SAY86_006805 [Trapa natans]|uniref:Uncharacterized protein n=1 Tax=Trapa natans TaxID=22666 RepID=A0AAN7L466_TRANT|nr:hypothetical protein SAY86_006805 [Trapa natans]
MSLLILHRTRRIHFAAGKVQAKLNEVTPEKSSNSAATTSSLDEAYDSMEKLRSPNLVLDTSSIPAFMTQISDLVKLVDSKNIIELLLKQMRYEVVIRKKDALESPPVTPAAWFMMPPNFQQLMPTLPSSATMVVPAPTPTSSILVPKPSLPTPAKAASSSLRLESPHLSSLS